MKQYSYSIVPPLRIAFLMWLVFCIEYYSGTDLGFLGVYPRELSGLIGILTMPLVHGSLQHLLSNTFPLLFLGTALFIFYQRIATWVFFNCYFATGLLVWVFGRPFYHIGASGLIYGLAFFLICLGLFRKDFKSILLSIIVLVFYGGIIYGLMPVNTYISWEAHLFGAIIGGTMAFMYRNTKKID